MQEAGEIPLHDFSIGERLHGISGAISSGVHVKVERTSTQIPSPGLIEKFVPVQPNGP
jgi:hypothetical protein